MDILKCSPKEPLFPDCVKEWKMKMTVNYVSVMTQLQAYPWRSQGARAKFFINSPLRRYECVDEINDINGVGPVFLSS